MNRVCILLAISCAGVAVVPGARALEVAITYLDGPGEGFNDPTLGAQRRGALEFAVTVWEAALDGTFDLKLSASFDPLGGTASSATLGQAGFTQIAATAGSELPRPNIWYPGPLASQLLNEDISNGSGFHMQATFNSDVDGPTVLGSATFYYGTDGTLPPGRIPFLATALHELGHALGFISLADLDTGAFPSGLPDVFSDNLTRTGAVNKDFTAMTDSERLAAITSGELYWKGAQVLAYGVSGSPPQVNAQGEVRMFAPNPVQIGSSVSHWDSGHVPDLLMEPSLTSNFTSLDATPAALMDIGWTLASGEGEGEGEGETPCSLDGPCPDFDAEGIAAYAALSLDWATADLDANGITDSWEMAVFASALCQRTGFLNQLALCAYDQNLETLEQEPLFGALLEPAAHVIAAALTLSSELQGAAVSGLGLTLDYTVAAPAAKAAGEPFSAQGDPDGDGLSNLLEFDNIQNAGLSRDDYVEAVFNPLLDGSTDISSLPVAGEPGVWLLAAVMAGIGALLELRRRAVTKP